MVKSMFAGVSGLKAHQQKMDVIGNNIANVNTWGYKAYSYNFQDSIYSTSIRSSGGATTAGAYGGRNPSQVGYGSSMASISFQYTTGAPSPTDNDLDCMIDGTGLFLVGGMINGGINDIKSSGLYLSRVGIFGVDNNGYLVDDQKNYVYGYALKDGTGIPEVPAGRFSTTGTADVALGNNGQPDTDGKYEVTILGITAKVLVKDSSDLEGLVQGWITAVSQNPTEDEANPGNFVAQTGGPLSDYIVDYDNPNTAAANANRAGTITLKITSKTFGAGNDVVTPRTDIDPAVTVNGFAIPQGWEPTPGVDYEAAIPAEFNDQLSAIRIPRDPKTGALYNLQSYSISEDGVIVGVDTQNRPITMGQLAIVAVENPNGLEKTSGYYFTIGDNAGDVEAVKPNTGPAGFIRSKFLEMPNVDLANEFSNMITTQRGFQANSKIITVTDEMLQELVNMKR